MNDDLDALDAAPNVPLMHDAIQDCARTQMEHGHILTRHVLVTEWIADDGSTYLSLNCGEDTKTWHARGMLLEGVAMIDQGDTFDTVLSAFNADEDAADA